jgi:hypothetical protein
MVAVALLVIGSLLLTWQSAKAQDLDVPSRDTEIERLFQEYHRLKTMEALPSTDGQRSKRPRGDFWIPGDIERLRKLQRSN